MSTPTEGHEEGGALGARIYKLRSDPEPTGSVVAASFYIARNGMRAWLRKGIGLDTLGGGEGDPDGLLSSPSCRLIKDQRKVKVGLTTLRRRSSSDEPDRATPVYVKRYNVFSWRVRLASLVGASPAFRSWEATVLLRAAGFKTPAPVAAIEYRSWGMLERSFFITKPVDGAIAADQYWWRLRRAPVVVRRAFIAGLAHLFAALHEAGVYHSDLKDANLLVRVGSDGEIEHYLLDLERVRQRPVVTMRRRVKNLVQLHRTLGRLATIRENLYFLRAYLGEAGRVPSHRRRWRRAVCAAARRKDLEHALRGVS
jgi:hypothetical protein